MDDFTKHYLIAALWSSVDDDGETLERKHSIHDLPTETIDIAAKDCKRFQAENAELLAAAYAHYDNSGRSYHPDAGNPQACGGNDFWLTRNGHGSGFWDHGIPGTAGNELSAAAERFGPVDLYTGDDGKLYFY